MIGVIQTRKDFRPMTVAERQARCRANGKGKHRGKRFTRKEYQALLQARAAAEAGNPVPPADGSPSPAETPVVAAQAARALHAANAANDANAATPHDLALYV